MKTARKSRAADARQARLCVLLIHRNASARDQLERCLEKSECKLYHARDRTEALPLMYQVQPDLIFLELDINERDCWYTFEAIRFFTDKPVILMAYPYQHAAASASPTNAVAVFEPIQEEIVNAVVQALPSSSFDSRSTPRSKRPGRQS